MGLRFRKSIKLAPGVKVNLNKNSASVSVGAKGKHYTVNSKGKTTTTVGIPGTGISYSTTSGGGQTKKTSKKSKSSDAPKNTEPKKKSGCAGCLTSFLAVFGILFILFMIIPTGDKKEDEKNPLGFNVDFDSSYRNDVTGRWRLARIAENKPIEEYALDYYRNYFKSNDEVHIIINFTLNTTNRILAWGNLLDVATMEYVDKEEFDAKIACSGMLLSEYLINTDTGEIEKVQPQTTDDSISDDLETMDSGTVETGEQAEQERLDAEQAEMERIAQEQAEADRIAAEQAEAERIAAEQAEAQRIAQEQAEDQRIAQEQAAQQAQQQMVWISATGSKYHSVPDCGRMDPANAYQMSLSDAQANGYGRCSKCH